MTLLTLVHAFFLILVTVGSSDAVAASQKKKLVVYSYDSFMAKSGIGPKIIPLFEKNCACQVISVSAGNAGQILTRIQLDEKRRKPTAHVVVGLDGPTWILFEPYAASWGDWLPKGYESLRVEARRKPGFLPIDYGFLSFMQDRRQLETAGLNAPTSVGDILDRKWKRRILLQDPRTSSVGLSFLLYLKQLFPKDFEDKLRQMRGQWLTLSPGWEAAYSLFLKGEAPLVWSYVSSQAYHEESGGQAEANNTRRYEALLFKEGQPMQIEGAALVAATLKDEAQRKLAQSFLEFLISEEVQRLIPLHQWMMPAREGVPLPASFEKLPKPSKIIPLPEDRTTIEEALKKWQGALH